MKHQISFLALLMLITGSAVGQTPRRALERGRIEELKGLTKIFVTTHARDKSLVKRVTSTIQKSLPGLTFVTSPTEAEIWLWVYALTVSEMTRIPPDLGAAPVEYGGRETRVSSEPVPAIRGSVFILRSGERKLIMEFSKSGGGRKVMAEQFAKEFIRTYQKAMASP